jgi:hypothetical protein
MAHFMIIFFLIVLPLSLFADVIVPLDGEKIYGEIVHETDSSLIIDGPHGEEEMLIRNIDEFIIDEKKLARKIKMGLYDGDVTLIRREKAQELEYGMEIKAGDSIITGTDGRAELFLYKNDVLRIKENSKFVVISFLRNRWDRLFTREFYLRTGTLICFVKKDYREIRPIEIHTPGAVISAAASLVEVDYGDDKRTTTVNIIEKEGNVGFRPKRMDIGEVVLKNNETAILDEKKGNITEEVIGSETKERLTYVMENLRRKNIRSIQYPKKPIPRKWIYIGAAGTALLGGGVAAAYFITRKEPEEEEEQLTSVKVVW